MDRRHDRQLLVFALVLLGATGLAAGRVPGSARVDAAAGQLLTPVEKTLTGLGDRVNGLLSGAHTLQELRAANARLEAENASLQTEAQKLDDLKRENLRLRDMLSWSRQRVDLDLVGASLVGRLAAEDPGSVRGIVRLDLGRGRGVGRHMAVADDRGLVGQVREVSEAWSDVLLITDPESRVEGRVKRSGATGIVFGTATGELVMRYIPQNATEGAPTVQEGDLVYTSGLSERFPPKLLIGQVLEVRQADAATHQEALVRPSVDFNALELVLVVTGWRPTADADAGEAGS